jgi:hypothetical protein
MISFAVLPVSSLRKRSTPSTASTQPRQDRLDLLGPPKHTMGVDPQQLDVLAKHEPVTVRIRSHRFVGEMAPAIHFHVVPSAGRRYHEEVQSITIERILSLVPELRLADRRTKTPPLVLLPPVQNTGRG